MRAEGVLVLVALAVLLHAAAGAPLPGGGGGDDRVVLLEESLGSVARLGESAGDGRIPKYVGPGGGQGGDMDVDKAITATQHARELGQHFLLAASILFREAASTAGAAAQQAQSIIDRAASDKMVANAPQQGPSEESKLPEKPAAKEPAEEEQAPAEEEQAPEEEEQSQGKAEEEPQETEQENKARVEQEQKPDDQAAQEPAAQSDSAGANGGKGDDAKGAAESPEAAPEEPTKQKKSTSGWDNEDKPNKKDESKPKPTETEAKSQPTQIEEEPPKTEDAKEETSTETAAAGSESEDTKPSDDSVTASPESDLDTLRKTAPPSTKKAENSAPAEEPKEVEGKANEEPTAPAQDNLEKLKKMGGAPSPKA